MAKPQLPHAVIRLYPKRGENDCAIATLASYLRRDYEEVLLAAGKVQPRVWEAGLYCTDFIKVANRLKVPVKWHKTFDLDADTGVLWVSYNDRGLEHVVLLDEGRIYDNDHDPISVWSPEDYFGHYNATPKQLLMRLDRDA